MTFVMNIFDNGRTVWASWGGLNTQEAKKALKMAPLNWMIFVFLINERLNLLAMSYFVQKVLAVIVEIINLLILNFS